MLLFKQKRSRFKSKYLPSTRKRTIAIIVSIILLVLLGVASYIALHVWIIHTVLTGIHKDGIL